MKFLVLLLCVFTLASCASLKKKCNEDRAYQSGYEAAKRGESLKLADKGAVQCKDFEDYSPSQYKMDTKTGFAQGLKEYCVEENFSQWGLEDGEKGRVKFPNNYSIEMKNCLADDKYKARAKKVYQKSFNLSYCNKERMKILGQDQAKQFKTLNTSGIRKICGKKSSGLIASMRAGYKNQMKTNCTSAFWMMKGEEAAERKFGKSRFLPMIQKCPSSRQSRLTFAYSKSYNERRKVLLEEERMGFERQKHQDMVNLEQDRIDAISNQPLVGGPFSGAYRFYYDGNALTSRCLIDSRRREARVIVHNPNADNINISGEWELNFYGPTNRLIKTEREREFLTLSHNDSEEFVEHFIPDESVRCSARFIQ